MADKAPVPSSLTSGTSEQDLSQVALDTKTFHITNIPEILYQEISRHYGIGVEIVEGNYKQRALDPNNPILGFPGTIAVKKKYEILCLSLWNYHHDEDKRKLVSTLYDCSFSYYVEVVTPPVLEIELGYSGGKRVYNRVHVPDTVLDASSLRFSALAILRAHQLTSHPKCVQDDYWKSQSNKVGY